MKTAASMAVAGTILRRAHLEAARRETARIEPLGADGRPANEGTIALVSISMSPGVRAGRAIERHSGILGLQSACR